MPIKKCTPKYMKTKYNWTPNDYDITFEVDKIPSNIAIDNVVNLSHMLQRLMPLSKKIHLNLLDYTPERNKKNQMGVYTEVVVEIDGEKKYIRMI